jgi:hypothetical protein
LREYGVSMRSFFSPAAVICMSLIAAGRAAAGPCTAEIGREQAKIDAALDREAGHGTAGVEGTAATDNRQPTPASIAAAERALGEGVSIREALAALDRARRADGKDDASGCRLELVDARKFLRE